MSEFCSIFKEEMDSFLHHLRSALSDRHCLLRSEDFLPEYQARRDLVDSDGCGIAVYVQRPKRLH